MGSAPTQEIRMPRSPEIAPFSRSPDKEAMMVRPNRESAKYSGAPNCSAMEASCGVNGTPLQTTRTCSERAKRPTNSASSIL